MWDSKNKKQVIPAFGDIAADDDQDIEILSLKQVERSSLWAESRLLVRDLLFALMFAVLLAGCGVNNIPTKEQAAKAAWSEVQNQYKRRTDLIGNLVETVKGFAEQERSVLTQVTEARSKASSVQIPADILTNPEAMKKFQDAQNTLGGALRQLYSYW